MPTFGSLFAGIGGIDLGLERAGWECRWQVEWDAWCQHNLGHHFDVPVYGDITAVDWATVERVDAIVGGFPCQPVSVAGRRRGQDDDRWLWPEFARAIRELRPGLVIVENVPGLLARGMGDVLGGLSALGFNAEWDVVPAAAVGAPHLRERVWIIGWRAELGRLVADPDDWRPFDAFRAERPGRLTGGSPLADPELAGLEGDEREVVAGANGWRPDTDTSRPGRWATEPDVGRVAHGVPARVDRLRALGNAVVPQVVQVIGERLMDAYRSGD